MSQTDQLVSKAIELQRNTLENGQRAMEQAVELPLQQSVALQRNAAQLVLDGLEIGNWLGTQSVEFTRDAMDSYLETVENAARDTSALTERSIQSAEMAGQRGLESTQQFASGFAGDGQAGSQPGTSEAGAPPGYRTPADAVAASAPQAPNPESPATARQQTGYAPPAAQPRGPPSQASQPQQPPSQGTPQQLSVPQPSPHQAPAQQTPPQQTPTQQTPQQGAPPRQIPAQQLSPGQYPSGQFPARQLPTHRSQPPQSASQVGRSARRPQTPSSATSEGPIADQPSGRPTPDSQRPVDQPATVGESEREAEAPTDNA